MSHMAHQISSAPGGRCTAWECTVCEPAMYEREPQNSRSPAVAGARRVRDAPPSAGVDAAHGGEETWAMPKSIHLTKPSAEETQRLSSLRSRCATPQRCMCSTPRSIWPKTAEGAWAGDQGMVAGCGARGAWGAVVPRGAGRDPIGRTLSRAVLGERARLHDPVQHRPAARRLHHHEVGCRGEDAVDEADDVRVRPAHRADATERGHLADGARRGARWMLAHLDRDGLVRAHVRALEDPRVAPGAEETVACVDAEGANAARARARLGHERDQIKR